MPSRYGYSPLADDDEEVSVTISEMETVKQLVIEKISTVEEPEEKPKVVFTPFGAKMSYRFPKTEKPQDEGKDLYDSTEVIGAHFRQGNSLYALWKGAKIGRFDDNPLAMADEMLDAELPADPDFNLKDTLDEHKIEEADRPFFVDCKNQQQFQDALEYLEQDKSTCGMSTNTRRKCSRTWRLFSAGNTTPTQHRE